MAAGKEPTMRVLMPGMQAFAPNIWIIDGPAVRDFGILFPTRMTVVKLADGSLWGEEVMFFHKAPRTIILDDFIQVHPNVEGKL